MQYLSGDLTVDPGDHTGIARWKGDLWPETHQINLSHAKNIRTLEDELSYMWEQFSAYLDVYKPRTVHIEGVEFWAGSLKSVTAAKRQNLSKLAYLVGGYGNEARRRGIPVFLPPASEWKGQMPNDVLERKIHRFNQTRYPSEHILNAVGIGFSVMGYLLNTNKQPQKLLRHKRRENKW